MRASVSTATGDDGTTGLIGGRRVSKSAKRICSYGEIDELNALIGLILVEEIPATLRTQLETLQSMLFTLGSDLAAPLEVTSLRIGKKEIALLEQWSVELESALPKLKAFILPRGTYAACLCHQARTVCRRAERLSVACHREEPLNTEALTFINRLSDYLFLAARSINHQNGEEDTPWQRSTTQP
jgi:cob(I)alamin adenosyltransferase